MRVVVIFFYFRAIPVVVTCERKAWPWY